STAAPRRRASLFPEPPSSGQKTLGTKNAACTNISAAFAGFLLEIETTKQCTPSHTTHPYSKKKTGAGGGDVEAGRILRTDFLLHETGRRREQHVGRRGRNQNKIDIFGFNFCLFESVEGSLARHVAGGFIFCGDATLFDSGAD